MFFYAFDGKEAIFLLNNGDVGRSFNLWNNVSQTMIPRKATAAALGNLLEKQVIKAHFRSTESEYLGLMSPGNLCLSKSPYDFDDSRVWKTSCFCSIG